MQIEIHAGNKLVISIDLNEVNNLVKTQLANMPAKAVEAEVIPEAVPEDPAPTPSEDDILGGEAPAPVESKSETKRKKVMEEAKIKEVAKPVAEKPAPKAEAAKPAPKPAPKKVEAVKPAKVEAAKPVAVKYDRTDVKHRTAISTLIEATLGKDWKVSDETRAKVTEFSTKAHGTLDFLVDGKICASFSEAFAKHMGK